MIFEPVKIVSCFLEEMAIVGFSRPNLEREEWGGGGVWGGGVGLRIPLRRFETRVEMRDVMAQQSTNIRVWHTLLID